MQKNNLTEYLVGSYERLSKEDVEPLLGNGKSESNSIHNQKAIISNYINSHSDLVLVKEYADDGYSGTNFNRPAFNEMLTDIEAGVINCIIVKDLSRLGRNYIETGRYIEEIFPKKGVRFIAISESYDSVNKENGSDDLIIPFLNLVNDAYCRDISMKIRSSLEMKQRKGEYVAPFAPYGYKRESNNKYQLVVDENAAITVKRIFQWKLEGYSNKKIADFLNDEGIDSPAYYKSQQGENYKAGFQTSARPIWSPLAILRILENRVYIGVLEQGKTFRFSHKEKTRNERDESEWYCIEDAHELIIDKFTFNTVQRLLAMDSRTSPKEEKLYLFSGLLECGICGDALFRRKNTKSGKTYIYYRCCDGSKRLKHEGASINEETLIETVHITIKKQIDTIIQMEELLKYVDELPLRQKAARILSNHIAEKVTEISNIHKLKLRLYEDMKEGLISKKEYKDFEAIYDDEEKRASISLEQAKKKLEQILNSKTKKQGWMEYFCKYKNIGSLNRKMLVSLVEKILVFPGNRIEIQFSYTNEFENTMELVKGYKILNQNKDGEAQIG